MSPKRGRRRQYAPKNQPDNGTPEVQRMRKQLVGHENDQRASYPLGVMLARNLLTQSEHDAALHYAHVFQKATGRWQSNEGGVSLGVDSNEGRDAAAKAARDWKAMADKLLAHGRQIKDAVDNLAIYSRFPGWLISLCVGSPVTISENKHMKEVVAAISSLQKEAVDGARRAA